MLTHGERREQRLWGPVQGAWVASLVPLQSQSVGSSLPKESDRGTDLGSTYGVPAAQPLFLSLSVEYRTMHCCVVQFYRGSR